MRRDALARFALLAFVASWTACSGIDPASEMDDPTSTANRADGGGGSSSSSGGRGDGGSTDGAPGASSGCAGGACAADPCVGVTCSGHGTCSLKSGAATCTCAPGYHTSGVACIADGGVFGMTIPSGHPRLLFNAANLTAAKAWYAAHPFTPASEDVSQLALQGLLGNNASACASATSWAIAESQGKSQTLNGYPFQGIEHSGTACDDCRWHGEAVLLTYDWCYGMMSPSDRSTLEGLIDAWMDVWRKASWGGPPMHQNNYYWGYLRNEFEWGVLRYDTNQTAASTNLDDVFNVRLKNDFYPAALSGGARGGVGQEGAQYGPYVFGYASIPLWAAHQMGRDMFGESNYFLAGIYAYIYGTTPDSRLFTWNDNDGYAPSSARNGNIADFMTVAALNLPSAPAGGHARQWLKNVGASPSAAFRAIDNGAPSPVELSTLPFDYYAAGPQYLFGRASWSASATAFMLQLGAEEGVGHEHADLGAFQIWRGGKWLSRESVGYTDSGISVVGLGGSGSSDVSGAIAHNTVAVGKVLPSNGGKPKVTRLQSDAAFSFASVDLSPVFKGSQVSRDFLFLRELETLIVFDRGANVFVAHCETAPTTSGARASCVNGAQELVVSSLLGSPSFRVVTEGGQSGQRRIEISTAQSPMVTVLQAKDAAAAALTPTLVDNGTSYTLTLAPSVSVQLMKGASSSGGSVTRNGTTTSLRADVEPMTVTASGPAWQ